mgnify:CR=1 FL=1
MPIELSRRQFTVEEYHRLAESGVLKEDDRVELIRGEILMMSPIGPRHAFRVSVISEVLTERVGKAGRIWTQSPVVLDGRTEPQPDILILKRRDDHFREHLPDRSDVLLAIEVADTSLAYDRQVKRPLYSAAGVPEYWIVDVNENVLERHTGPRPDGYMHTDRLRPGDTVTLVALASITIPLSDLIG